MPGEPEFRFWACGPWFCTQNHGRDERLDPYTGAATGQAADAGQLGKWEPIGEYAGRTLVRRDPSWTADAKTWLGVVVEGAGETYRVHPLMALGGRANSCTVTGQWLYCDGSMLVDAVSVRLSDLDALLAEGGLDGADRSGRA